MGESTVVGAFGLLLMHCGLPLQASIANQMGPELGPTLLVPFTPQIEA
jgi:hypothetical protein